jgi:phosphopentomutase
VNIGTRASFADIGATVEDAFGLVPAQGAKSFWREIVRG